MNSILIIEPSEKWRKFLAKTLTAFFKIHYCCSRQDISKKVKSIYFDVILLDIDPDNSESIKDLHKIKIAAPFTPVVVTCKYERAELVVSAIKKGAFDYIVKPYIATKIKVSLEKALENISLKNEIDYLRHEQDVIYNINRIIASSLSMKKIINDIKKFSLTDSTILMTGETGTGKSLLAGAIHYNSKRRGKPFVKINCANIQETLLESELFGHNKGSFTGADKLRIGRFEQANGGSIFLDEIGEMSMALQGKLLRVIEDKSFERVGGNRTIRSDVRIIAATNKNLEKLVSEGKFREDLYYRVNVLPILLPPLRKRQECLEPLAQFLLFKIGRDLKKTIPGFSRTVIENIMAYSWPGNIRQLANTIERALLLEETDQIQIENFILPGEQLFQFNPLGQTISQTPKKSLVEHEKENIVEALEQSLWIQKDAAGLLGVSPRVLNHKIKKFGITHKRWRKNIN